MRSDARRKLPHLMLIDEDHITQPVEVLPLDEGFEAHGICLALRA